VYFEMVCSNQPDHLQSQALYQFSAKLPIRTHRQESVRLFFFVRVVRVVRG
jgi:hypothetical protein